MPERVYKLGEDSDHRDKKAWHQKTLGSLTYSRELKVPVTHPPVINFLQPQD